ncbi:Fumble family protein [Trichomonas vaginalis G3]|uniref:Fumble family protein n=4 Tax=Trichomonas vaginalis (strain ATCC PRA-98 / G3) TaxID=412133 RepID=A2GZQ5_TRIV3|nr:pantothenate kinase protein [Trichomonas vaginalis G3]XP_051086100.1 pantothenate kinase protein [Trichomonas vaginalis G3]EAX77362.1 Fumble family protein [Trichomonas vaginalis G3]KAI5502305.1 pantothenate kinase protein [Trichomonas vaginalis G3]KAI5502366.1 pantothenate kinase protein [Trichomonas vaginalis G3]|eukprot:XP_001290292.1 Fumble family protein [Trichomonas vaginalis G3]
MLGVDLGGSFTKMCFIGKDGNKQLFCIPTLIEEIKNFFQTDENGELKIEQIHEKIEKICITGGGSVKFREFFEQIKPKPVKLDELGTQAFGAAHLLKDRSNVKILGPQIEDLIPCIIISMGTGVSYSALSIDNKVKHVGGSPLGGGTLLGLANLLIQVNNFDEILRLANIGKTSTLDLLISDIYGQNYGNTLLSDVCASSFAKASIEHKTAPKEDIAASLLSAICYSIAGGAATVARAEKVTSLVFVGGFLSMEGSIPDSLYKSASLFNKEISLIFPENHRYAGAIGAALRASELQ